MRESRVEINHLPSRAGTNAFWPTIDPCGTTRAKTYRLQLQTVQMVGIVTAVTHDSRVVHIQDWVVNTAHTTGLFGTKAASYNT